MGTDGFHDVMIENLSASPTWRSSHVMPADVTALRRRWPFSSPCAGGRRKWSIYVGSTRVGFPPRRTRILLDLPRRYRVGPGCTYHGIPSGIGSIVALPGGVVRRVERIRE